MPLLSYLAHRRDCLAKQQSRQQAIASLSSRYHDPLSAHQVFILNTALPLLIPNIKSHEISPYDVLTAYAKRALQAHAKTNCLTEIMIVDEEKRLEQDSGTGATVRQGKRPLEGIPVSLKDTVSVAGYDSCIGYSGLLGKKKAEDAPLVKLLRDAGAMPFVKTNVPITLLSFESANDVFGRTTNPYNAAYSPGGSSGGESALIAFGGSRIGVGTDVAGSVRIPAHFSGIYTIRCSHGRFPRSHNSTSMSGQEGVMAVYSPMARSMPDLVYFLRSIIEMKPWTYDQACSPIPWRMKDIEQEYSHGPRRWAVMPSDGVVNPTLACQRAVDITVDALRKMGDEVIEFTPEQLPTHPKDMLRLAAHLLNSDGGKTYESHFRSFFERGDPGAVQLSKFFKLPRWMKWIYVKWVRYVRGDKIWADLVEGWSEKTVEEQWLLVGQREMHRNKWFEWFTQNKIDFLITPPNALPAIPHKAMKTAVSACGYTFMFNLLDLPVSVLPITSVNPTLDTPSPTNRWIPSTNRVARGIYKYYDATAMEGLPVGVQIVGMRRLEEERVLWATGRVEEALGRGSWASWGCGEIGKVGPSGNGLCGGKGWEGGIEVGSEVGNGDEEDGEKL
ncbi:amidase signature domain-containing protein [Terfezia claveryi]|nr:amidase signature domain-containing protein [Terfezia claveryi]